MNKILELHGKKRLEYIWNYYKLHIGVLLVGIYVIIYIIFRIVTATTPEIYLGFVNVSAGTDLMQVLTDDFLEELNTGNPRSSIYKYEGLLLTENVDSSNANYVQASQIKILAAINGQMFDVVILDKEALDAFSQNGYLYNMEDFLEENAPDQYEELKPYLVKDIEILQDNSDEIIFHPEVEYVSECTEYPMALDLSFCPAVSRAGFGQTIYLAVIRNSARPEVAGNYISYLESLK